MNSFLKTYKTDYFFIFIGSIILAMGVAWFADPAQLVPGGLSGLSIVIKHLTDKYIGWGVPLWLTTLVLNIPLFLISAKQRGFKYIIKSVIAVIILTGALALFEYVEFPFAEVKGDIMMCALASGILVGAGIALVLRANTTTGGSDMLAGIIKKRYPHFAISILILIIDCMIIASGLLAFGILEVLYSVLSVAVASFAINFILEGLHFAKAAYIISHDYKEITRRIFDELDRGVSSIKITGMFTGEEREMLFVVLSKKEISKLIRLVKQIDKRAFITVSDVRGVIGEGFLDRTDTLGGM